MSSVIFEYNHQPIIKWEGRTFNQITSTLKKNPGLTGTSTQHNFFLANPLKIYRKEIANKSTVSTCSRRASLKIDEFDRPGGSIINTNFSSSANGLISTVDNVLPNNICEEPGTCLAFLSPAMNAKRRCRSAGMIHQKYNGKNLPKYFTDAKQYLHSRNYTFDQNQFRYPVSDPSYCVTYKPNNTQFAQQGGVTASSLTARLKYDAIQTAAVQTAKPLGIATANALAYGVPENGYTVKDIIGYPNPYFQKDKLKCLTNSSVQSAVSATTTTTTNTNTTPSYMVFGGQGSNITIATTTDGINYSTNIAPSGQVQVTAFSGFQNVVCFWGGSATCGPTISSDGINWSSTLPLPPSNIGVNAATYFNNKYYAGGYSYAGIFYSTDPRTIQWSKLPIAGLLPGGMFACTLNSVPTIFVLNQNSTGNLVFSSVDGVTWQGSLPNGSPFYRFDSNRGNFGTDGTKVILSGNKPFPFDSTIVYTTDGVSWNNCSYGNSLKPSFGRIAYGNGLWMIAGASNTVTCFWTSTDGITFTQNYNVPFINVSTIGYINGTWVTSAYNSSNLTSKIAYSTNNGSSWTILPSAFGVSVIRSSAVSNN